MQTFGVVLFCSHLLNIAKITELLNACGVVNLHVVSGDNQSALLPPPMSHVDLVICDSFRSLREVHYFRVVCEHFKFFSVIKSEELDASFTWGISNFRLKTKKYYAGRYKSVLDGAQIRALVDRSLVVKKTVNNYIQSNNASTASSTVLHAELLCELEVLRALDEKEIIPYFQPKICLATQKILGAEVLARWKHPQRGLLSPLFFLQVISNKDLHQQLFSSLLAQGLTLHKYLYSIGESLMFSYNIEASQLAEIGFAAGLVWQIKKAGVPLNQITLEITEKEGLALDMECVENITVLIKNGLNLSLDDFGTGYSSMMRLADMPFSQIKLDADFVARSLGQKETRIIECVAALANSLDLELVAEGVETEAQRAHLQRLGVDSAQGYLFHKPMEGAALLKVILAGKPHKAIN